MTILRDARERPATFPWGRERPHTPGSCGAVAARWAGAPWLALGALALAGCDTGPTTYEPLDLPPVHVTEILAATAIQDVAGQVSVTYGPLDLAHGSSLVASTTSFKIRFDRLLLPDTATRQAGCLQPLLGNVVQPGGCAAGIFFEPSYDPVLRQVTYRQTSDNAPLVPGTRYELTLFSAVDPTTQSGILSFDGIPLETPLQVEFGVLDDPPDGRPPYDPPIDGDHFCTAPDPTCTGASCARPVSKVLGGCAYAGCHAGNPDMAAMGMELDTPADITATALGHVAHETETGEAATIFDPSSPRFGRSMPILAPGVPGDSYLVYKLLANHLTPLTVPFAPDPANPAADPPEIVRLQRELVVGMPMPPSNAATFLRPGEAEWLSEWLLQGAPVPACK